MEPLGQAANRLGEALNMLGALRRTSPISFEQEYIIKVTEVQVHDALNDLLGARGGRG